MTSSVPNFPRDPYATRNVWALFPSIRQAQVLSLLVEISSGAILVIFETLMPKRTGWAVGRSFVFDFRSVWACPGVCVSAV